MKEKKLEKIEKLEPEFPSPPSGSMWLIPLGGIGEIGKNMSLLHYDDEILVMDSGLMFPTEDMFGVDLVIPDIHYLTHNKEKVKGIVLTHGHEDHIGALPYILEKINVPVYGTKLTLAILRGKLREFTHLPKIELIEFEPEDTLFIGNFKVDTFRVVHSITEGVGLAIHTPFGVIIHSGDFKFDDDPVDGKKINKEKLTSIGKKGALLLLSDSTYADRFGHSSPEKEVGKALEDIFAECKGRIIVTTFASSIPRIQQVINCAEKYGRKISFLGRSLVNNVAITSQLGFLRLPENLTFKIADLSRLPDEEIVVLTTGSQGEPMSVLTLMATCNYKWIQIKPNDTVILSATPVPGNETVVNNTVNLLFKLGADVIYNYSTARKDINDDMKIHVSGHASQDELKELINLVKPKYFIPIHGEQRHLVHHSRLAADCGIKPGNIFILENGSIIEINKDGIKTAGKIPCSEILVDGLGVGDIGRVVLRDRQQLSNDGICIVVGTVDRTNGELLSGPELISRGFVYFEVSKDIIEEAKRLAKDIFAESYEKQSFEVSALKTTLREKLTKLFQKKLKRRPIIVPIILEV